MNIFDIYLDKIKKLAIKLNKENVIEIPESLNGINVDVPPSQFDCDISTNVAMVLSKLNKKSPIDLANQLSEFIKKDDKNINLINVVNPGFINIKFEKQAEIRAWTKMVDKANGKIAEKKEATKVIEDAEVKTEEA